MNQKYLCGVAINGQKEETLAYFEATPENVAAFLCAYPSYRKIAVCTTDGKPFLTVDLGLRVTIPDQKYFYEKLMPILHPIQQGEAEAPKLKTVSKGIAEAEPCPKPDWNYLHWDGYSDEKYQSILNRTALLDLSWRGEKLSLEIQVRYYYTNGNLAVLFVNWSRDTPGMLESLTVNSRCHTKKDCSFINVGFWGKEILPWIEKNSLGHPTGRIERYGFVTYPEYHFNMEKLRELDEQGYQMYAQQYKEAAKKHPSWKKGGKER
ncbi:MAG: DUF4332 domain-containing protein [Clostridium sp.]|jgi:hypothetical protein